MDTYVGKYFTTSAVNPGHDLKCWRFIVFKNVDFTGEKHTVRRYCASSICVFSCECLQTLVDYRVGC